jgi:beta-galactosidase
MMRYFMAIFFPLFLAAITNADPLHTVATDAFDSQSQSNHLIDGERYTFSTAEIPADVLGDKDPLRNVAYAAKLRFGYSGAKPAAVCTLRLTFVSELQRSISISVNSTVIDEHLQIPPGKVTHFENSIQADSDGEIDLSLGCLEGPNAEVSKVEILSADDTPLLPMKNPQEAEQRRLDAMIKTLPNEPVHLSPRPQFVQGVAHPLISLNGQWKFSPEMHPHAGSDTSAWKNIAVPGEWVMQGFAVPPDGTGCYSRMLDIPADWAGHRVKLRFDSVNSDCTIFVNGQKVDDHEGGFVPFECDITGDLQQGSNRLNVQVRTQTTSDTLGSVSQYAAHPVGGILRKVQLFALPNVNLSTQVLTTELTDGGDAATLSAYEVIAVDAAKIEAAGIDAGTIDDSRIEFQLTSPDGKAIPIEGVGTDRFRQIIRFPIAHPQLWDSEHPRLYHLQTRLVKGKTITETIEQPVGFRQIEIKGNQVLVNFHPVKLLGVCRHEVSPLTGRSVSPELCRRDAELFRAANCNYIRTSHYPPSEEFLEAADELGLFVEDESALCWIQHNANAIWKQWDYRDPKFLPYMLQSNFQKMATGRDHPSVIIWSLGNESYWSPLWAEVMKRVAAVDPTRPITFHDQCWGGYNNNHNTAPIGVYHYPGMNGPAKCDTESRPILFGEYSHIECYNRRELVTDPGMRDDWGRPQEKMVDLIQAHPGCLGGAIWSGIDDIFHLPDGTIVGYGPWGIIDGWRREKPEYWHVKKTYSPIRVVDRDKPIAVGLTDLEIPIENRYNFSNLSEVKIDWAMGAQKGTTTSTIAPRTSGVLEIHLPQPTQAGQSLELSFTDPRGFICESESLKVESSEQPAAFPVASKASIEESDDSEDFHSTHAHFRIDRHTGAFTTEVNGKPVISNLGFMLLPLNEDSGSDGGVAGNDYHNHILPFTPECSDWKLKSVNVDADKKTVHIDGSYAQASGSYELQFTGDGAIIFSYSFTTTKAIKPRQWGAVLTVPNTFDTLNWERKAQWTTYPADHIGRPIGTAKANPQHRDAVEQPGLAMTGAWSLDTMDMGSNDFRSTKYHIRQASLLDSTGSGLHVQSNGSDSVRAWVDGTLIHLLVAGYHTGGSDGFFAGEFASERRPLKAGQAISGQFLLDFPTH